MAQLLIELEIDRVDLVDEGANSEAFIKLYKRRSTIMTFEEIVKSLPEEQVAIVTAEIAKVKAEADAAMATMKTEADAAMAKVKEEAEMVIAKAKEDVNKQKDEPKSTEEVIKSLDPAVQAIFKSLQDKQIAAETIAKQLKEQNDKEIAIAKSKELVGLPVAEDTLVEIAKTASPEIFNVLKAASKLIVDSDLFKEKGNGSKGEVDAWSKIEKAAAEIAIRDDVTKQKAIAIVIKEQPQLYTEYLKGGQ